jgi:hypothetical protein
MSRTASPYRDLEAKEDLRKAYDEMDPRNSNHQSMFPFDAIGASKRVLTFIERRVVMKVKSVLLVLGVLLLLVAAYQPAEAEVNVGISIGLPLFTFHAPPHLVVIPGTYAYYVADADVDIIFYQGRWYRPHGGRWYWARAYNGPWLHAGPRFVPAPLLRLPRDYRRGVVYARIPYHDLNRNWRTWERNRHWEKRYDWWRKAREDNRGTREIREDRRERKEDRREIREDSRERQEDRREIREDRRERQEDRRERQEDRR